MKEQIKLKGQWFLPGKQDGALSGTLLFDSLNGAELEVHGMFGQDTMHIPIIWGVTSSSQEVTLYKCYFRSSEGYTFIHGQAVGHPGTFYGAVFVLIGHHFEKPADIVFDTLTAEIEGIDRWLRVNGFDVSKINHRRALEGKIGMKYSTPDPIEFNLKPKLRASFSFKVEVGTPASTSIMVKQRTQFNLNTKGKIELKELLLELQSFVWFLTIGLYEPVFPTKIVLSSNTITKDWGEGDVRKKVIELHFVNGKRKSSEIRMHNGLPLFTYTDIRGDFQAIIHKWYDLHGLLEPVFNLFFEQFYLSNYDENSFLNLAQAAESFHARLHKRTRMPKAEYQEMRREILGLAPVQYHDWLNGQFNFGNSLSLHQRLEELLEKYSNSTIDDLIGDRTIFIKQVKDSRNYYTHFSKEGKKKALTSGDLVNLGKKVKALLTSALLIETGIPAQKVSSLMADKKHWYFDLYSF